MGSHERFVKSFVMTKGNENNIHKIIELSLWGSKDWAMMLVVENEKDMVK